MSNEYFVPGTVPAPNSPGASGVIRGEFQNIATGFDKLPVLAGNADKFVAVNSTGTAMTASDLSVETLVNKTSSTGSAILPAGVTSERDESPLPGYLRFNLLTNSIETYYIGGWGAIAGVQGAQGPTASAGPQGMAGPTGPQGIQGIQGPPGNDATATLITGEFGASKVPGDLPASGLIPQNWDAVGVPSVATQLSIGDTMYYTVDGDLYVFVSTDATVSGWLNIGPLTGPTGATGPQGAQGPQGLQGIQGAVGPTGSDGPAGAQGIIGATGPAGLVWKHTYNPATSYVMNDAFVYNGTSYICLTSVTGIVPPSAEYSILAQAGAEGIQGPTGATGSQGIQGIPGPTGPAASLSDTAPLIDGTALAGISTNASRGDHVHPTDTSRAAASDLATTNGNLSLLDDATVKRSGSVATGAVITPVGTTAQRPAGSSGLFRYNSDLAVFEGYSGGAWSSVPGVVSGKTVTFNNTLTFVGTDDTTITLPTVNASLVGKATTDTLTNKRFTPRVGSTASSATPTINTDNVDVYKLTAQAVDITSFTTNLSGTPSDNDVLIIEITGTAARAITWGSAFEASTVALPTTTVSTNMLAVGFIYNSATSKWRCVASV